MDEVQEIVRLAQQDLEEDRFSRFRLISWWKQERLRTARVLVIGAGALGNEILKNLALLGIGRIVIVDQDRIECSNLSRSILYKADDIGKPKSEVAAEATRRIFPDCTVHHLNANVLFQVGTGLFGWADIIIAGLDNREARLCINRCAWKMNRPWVDGAIEGINGVARVFLPGQPPCYECTLGETDWEILEKRMSCNLLSREEMESGKTPTTPTTASVIAGIQVQEAIKYLHDLPVLSGKGFIFDGLKHNSYVIEYTANDDCMSHQVANEILSWKGSSNETTFADLLSFARDQLNEHAVVVEFSHDIIDKLTCPKCGSEENIFACVGTVRSADGKCGQCGTMREVKVVHSCKGDESWAGMSLSATGLPPFDVFSARSGDGEIFIRIDGDAATVLGPCFAGDGS